MSESPGPWQDNEERSAITHWLFMGSAVRSPPLLGARVLRTGPRRGDVRSP
jgi:hypothetical protein